MENLNLVSGLEVGFGGVWVGAAPYLLFMPDRDGDDMPDGEPRSAARRLGLRRHARNAEHVHLGPRRLALRLPRRVHALASRQARHARRRAHAASTPASGAITPRGTSSKSSPTARAIPGASTSTTTARLLHGLRHSAPVSHHPRRALPAAGRPALQSAHLRRHQDHRRPSPLDRRHAPLGQQPLGRRRRRTRPCRRDDLSGRKLAREVPRPDLHEQHPRPAAQRGSAHAAGLGLRRATARPTFCLANDRWSQIINLQYGPDGQVFMIDWYDKNACHHRDANNHDRTNGRIFKVVYDNAKPGQVDLQKRSDDELIDLQLDDNDWYRAVTPAASCKSAARTRNCATSWRNWRSSTPTRRAACAACGPCTLTGGLRRSHGRCAAGQRPSARAGLDDSTAHRRSVARSFRPTVLEKLAALAKNDPSPVVRLYLSSALQRLPLRCTAGRCCPACSRTPKMRATTTCR